MNSINFEKCALNTALALYTKFVNIECVETCVFSESCSVDRIERGTKNMIALSKNRSDASFNARTITNFN